MGFHGGSDSKELACNAGDLDSKPGFWKIPWRREWQPTSLLFLGEFHGQLILVGSWRDTQRFVDATTIITSLVTQRSETSLSHFWRPEVQNQDVGWAVCSI